MKLSEIADTIAAGLSPGTSFDDIWDECDTATGGELDTVQMDILSKMVEQRLKSSESGLIEAL